MGLAERLNALDEDLPEGLTAAIERATTRMADMPSPLLSSPGIDMEALAQIVFTAVGQHRQGSCISPMQMRVITDEAKELAKVLFGS